MVLFVPRMHAGWFPPFKYFAKKIGLGKMRRRKLLQDIHETQKLLDKSKDVLNLDLLQHKENNEKYTTDQSQQNIIKKNTNARHTMDDDILFKRLAENKRRKEFQRLTGLRKHRGRVKTSPANMMKVKDNLRPKGLKLLNSYVPKLNPTGATAARIKLYGDKVASFQSGGDFRNGNSIKRNMKHKRRSRGDSGYNPTPKHWPPPSYRKEISYVANAGTTITEEKFVRVVTKEEKMRKRNSIENQAKVARRKAIKNALKKSFNSLNAKSKKQQKYMDSDNNDSSILQLSTNRTYNENTNSRNKSGRRRVSFSNNVYVHTIDRKL